MKAESINTGWRNSFARWCARLKDPVPYFCAPLTSKTLVERLTMFAGTTPSRTGFCYCLPSRACKQYVSSRRQTLIFVTFSIATLPGEEDVAGLQALLDPNTLEGRAARIALLTRGSGPLSLATCGDLPFQRRGGAAAVSRGGSSGLLVT